MNYIPVVAWGLCPGGTDKQIANYFGSWGLYGDASSGTGTAFYRIPTHPTHPTHPTFAGQYFMALLVMLTWQ